MLKKGPMLSVALVLLGVLSIPEVHGYKFESEFGQGKEVQVQTASGPVVGLSFPTHQQFLGIPYAQPPVGALRWQPPVPVTSWTEPLQAFEYAAACPQNCVLPPHFCPEKVDEACLHLNVWAPSAAASSLRPVMVFFAGGAFFQGDGGTPIYDGNYFVNATDVVLVTCSYRLGALGFLYGAGSKGNFGLQDQRLVLNWVQQNAQVFGGDPTRVTIFGESAGAESVGAHLSSPLSKGLFHAAIMESNPLSLEFKHPDEAATLVYELAGLMGCSEDPSSILDCLRSKSAADIVDVEMEVFPLKFPFNMSVLLPWTPVIDQVELSMQPLMAFETGNYNQMPVLIGTNRNEGRMFVWQVLGNPMSHLEYDAAILAAFRSKVIDVLDQYPAPGSGEDARVQFARVLTDYLFACPSRRAAMSLSNQSPTFMYVDSHVLAFPQAYGPNYSYCGDYVCHGSELPILFGTYLNPSWNVNYTQAEVDLTQNMQTWWANMAYSASTPNAGLRPAPISWEQFNGQSYPIMNLTTPPYMSEQYLLEACDFWDKLGYEF